MEIRAAKEADIPSIVELLKLSLGESLMPKSEAFWRWKHIDNPFGKSPVLLAFEKEQLIGVRAFMRWNWQQGDNIFKSLRAVDTATHPQHQGKGIFKKLTLQLLEQSKAAGDHFIFNTPNKQSMPGYLKMGWQSRGKMTIGLRPLIPFRSRSADFEQRYACDEATLAAVWPTIGFRESSQLRTHQSLKFLQWRYAAQFSNLKYYLCTDETRSFAAIFRLKKHAWGMEFRLCECLLTEQTDRKSMRQAVREAMRLSGARLVSYAGNDLAMWLIKSKVGPQITLHPLNQSNSLSFSAWNISLGDMEVF